VSAMEYSCHAGLSIVPAGLSPLTCRGSQDFVLGYFQSPFGLRRPGFGPGVFFFLCVAAGALARRSFFLLLSSVDSYSATCRRAGRALWEGTTLVVPPSRFRRSRLQPLRASGAEAPK
jgi:hypothetical protein